MGYSDFANIFSETKTYKSVETFAAEHRIDLAELKATTTDVFRKDGKIPAIKHVNACFNLGRPLPLLSTKNYVEQIESAINNEQYD
ncbi:hypothetical protein CW745_01435 [Psychromonas sp. psych-6C06]|uniref:hypothetical protein n=1 Tax=Psychromonas sp. psych-6C06 TaxID=2058089 RepID=UPI000C3260C9|nr:hypothetical protein [Psychromonas sp. psych-6C06]PKF63542.1 hypothetical protein CW745_01435 [Psychromonas sp. psych-6C06]